MMITSVNRSNSETQYSHDVLCDYPGCMSYKTYRNDFSSKDFDATSNLVNDGWSVVRADEIEYKLFYCPEHHAYLKRISKNHNWVIDNL